MNSTVLPLEGEQKVEVGFPEAYEGGFSGYVIQMDTFSPSSSPFGAHTKSVLCGRGGQLPFIFNVNLRPAL